MRIEIRVKVFAISREDHNHTEELIDELWAMEEKFFKEYSDRCGIDYTVDEGIEGEDEKAISEAHEVMREAKEEYDSPLEE